MWIKKKKNYIENISQKAGENWWTAILLNLNLVQRALSGNYLLCHQIIRHNKLVDNQLKCNYYFLFVALVFQPSTTNTAICL